VAGTVTATTTRIVGGVRRTTLAWTSDASGDVSATTTVLPAGTVLGVAFTPGSGGTQPSDAYDVTLLCADHSVDVLAGEGANLSNATATHKQPMASNAGTTGFARVWAHSGNYQLVVANAGNAKTGTVEVFQVMGVV
jgi:hypothetical protein